MIAFQAGEHVRVSQPPNGAAPQSFTWRGQRHWVQAVEISGMSSRKQNVGMAEQVIYQLRTATGMRCTLAHDRVQGVWRLESILNAGGRP
jgi:hypothetical protein